MKGYLHVFCLCCILLLLLLLLLLIIIMSLRRVLLVRVMFQNFVALFKPPSEPIRYRLPITLDAVYSSSRNSVVK